jgi:AraC-like DNA-binding protein
MNETLTRKKYLVTNAADQLWKHYINSVGTQTIAPHQAYPPSNHPTRYLFNTKYGRVLDEYQILYITHGKGTFASASCSKRAVKEGDAFILFPEEWHSYCPDPDSGWTEYWIGFNGEIVDQWVKDGFFTKENPIFNIGLNEELIILYKRAIIIAEAQEACYQQALSGIACNILGMLIYLSKNRSFIGSDIAAQIDKAKIAIHENISTINPEALAKMTCMSYSAFRKSFKEYTGFAPSQYILEVKMKTAKEMLTNTSATVKEIAYELGYDNKDYFFTVFRKLTGTTPTLYRRRTQGEGLIQDKE